MNNPFNNLEELKELIRQGKTNDEIINARIEYLSSDEYINSRDLVVDSLGEIDFYNGFINKDMIDTYYGENSIHFSHISYYKITSKKYYEYILNIIRKYNDLDDLKLMGAIFDYVRSTFRYLSPDKQELLKRFETFRVEFSEKVYDYMIKENEKNPGKYNDALLKLKEKVINIYKKNLNNGKDYRDFLLDRLSEYTSVNYNGDFEEFLKARFISELPEDLKEEKIIIDNDNEYLSLYKKYLEAVNNKTDNNVVDLTEIEGFGTGKCLEMSMLSQNMLSFVGYDSYKLGGYFNKNKNNLHAYNIVTLNDDKTIVFDVALKTFCIIASKAFSKDEVKNAKDLYAKNNQGTDIFYTGFVAEKNKGIGNL